MGRIHDILKTFLGRSEAQVELGRMRADFSSLMLDVSNAMEKMKTATLKLAKRDTRALDAALTEDQEATPAEHATKWDARAEVMKRGRQHRTVKMEAPDVSSDQERTG